MSLINEALKKAQKLRTGDPAAVAPMPGGGPRVTKRGEPRSTQQLVLIAAGGILLVVLSVVATFWFINRAPAPAATPKPIAVKSANSSAPNPTLVPPAIKSPTVAETSPTKSAVTPVATEHPPGSTAANPPPATNPATPPQTAPTMPSAATSVATTAAEPPAADPAPTPPATAPAAAPAANVPTDARIHAFVDNIKVMGIRSSGGDSRVLMNDRVFRVNDIVDRNLGVRLTKVAPDALTFTDSNGAIYVKNF